MWLNNEKLIDSAIRAYRKSLLSARPNHVVIDGLFSDAKLNKVLQDLQQPLHWQTQRHTYSALYVNDTEWEQASNDQRFVQRDAWQPKAMNSVNSNNSNTAQAFLTFLRSEEFMSVLSHIFNVQITDLNVADPIINTNFFRLNSSDFVEQHADDSPGREICMLLYLNKDWDANAGGELVFAGKNNKSVKIAPLFNRCVLFDPSSEGSEHWVERLKTEVNEQYRYNVTSWYWSE